MATNKDIAIKVIKEEYPGISQKGINALLANIEIETGFNKFVEIPQDYDKVIANSDLKSMQKNLKTLKGGKKAYDKLSDQEKLGVLYHGDKKAKYAGGIGGLQLTSSNYGGLQNFEGDLNKIAATLKMKPEDLYKKAKTDPATAIRLSIVHLRDIKKVNVQELNVSDGKTLRKQHINPYESQGVETPAQAARDTIFNTYAPRVLSSSATPVIETGDDVDKGSDIKNKDNLEYLRRRAQQGPIKLSDSDVDLVANVAEDQRVMWSKLGVPSIADTILNATGLQQNKIGVDDDTTNQIHRTQVIEALSEGLDMSTIDGKKVLRQRLKSYAELVKSDGWKEKVDALAGTVRETSYQNMIEDLSFDYRTLIVDANKIHKLEGSEKIDYEDSVRMPDEEGVISDNKAVIQAEINKGNTELSERVAKEGLDKVAVDLAKVQKDAAESGDLATDAATLLSIAKQEEEIAARDKSLTEGVERGEALALEDDDTEEEEESMESLGLNEDGSRKPSDEEGGDDTASKISGAEKVLTGLKAAAGLLSLSQALAEPDIDTPELSPLIYESLNKQAQLAKSGLTAKEKAAAMGNLNNAYAGAMKNVLRASGGQRGLYLANQGTVDANRIAGLNQLAAQDAALHRQNIQQYNQLASSVGQMKLQRDMGAEQMRQTTLANNKQILSGVGTNLLSDAISDVGYYLNPNRKATEAMTQRILEGNSYSGDGYENRYTDTPVGTASTRTAEQIAADKEAKKQQEKLEDK